MNHFIKIVFLSSLIFTVSACSSSKKDPYQDLSAETIYKKGKENSKKSRYTQSIKDFEALEARFPYGDYTDKAQLALIDAYHKKGESASALAAADRFIRIHPRHPHVDYAYYMKGIVNFEENYSMVYRYFPIKRSKRDPSFARQAFDDFKVLTEKFPNSEYAADARQRMIHLRNQLAEHELHIADHFYQKGAFLAAANRAGYIVNQFDQSSTVPQALVVMIKSYRELGMKELANDTLKILSANYPDSPELKKVS